MSTKILECLAFSEAKAQLSHLMTAVVHDHSPMMVDRHQGKEEMLLVSRDDLLAMLEPFQFEPKASFSAGEFILRLPELGLIAGGETLEDAVAELVELAEEYAEQYFSRLAFFMETDRRQQFPWVARVAFTAPEARAELFSAAPKDQRVVQTAA